MTETVLPGKKDIPIYIGKTGLSIFNIRIMNRKHLFIALLACMPGLGLTSCSNNTAQQPATTSITVKTTIAADAGYSYDGLEMQIGSWKDESSAEQTVLGTATIADGTAVIPADLSAYGGKDIWVCIPKVAKFFHTLTDAELNAKTLTLPDKDKGSTLKPTPTIGADNRAYVNDWIVALYIGINKGGSTSAQATPIYWATGDLVATKIGEDSNRTPSTLTSFHIATAEENRKESTPESPFNFASTITESSTNGYASCEVGSQWILFGWGDPDGLKTSRNNEDYAPGVMTDICGTKYDIARVQLGGSWRLPTAPDSNNKDDNECAALDDAEKPGLLPDGEMQMEGGILMGYSFTHKIENAGTQGNTITNTISFAAMGCRNRLGTGTETTMTNIAGNFWSGTVADDSGKVSQVGFWQGYPKDAFTAYYNDRFYGIAVRPVSE